MPVCRCACHDYPGTYWAEPCNVCGHFHSKGHMVGMHNQGWIPCENKYCEKHGNKI